MWKKRRMILISTLKLFYQSINLLVHTLTICHCRSYWDWCQLSISINYKHSFFGFIYLVYIWAGSCANELQVKMNFNFHVSKLTKMIFRPSHILQYNLLLGHAKPGFKIFFLESAFHSVMFSKVLWRLMNVYSNSNIRLWMNKYEFLSVWSRNFLKTLLGTEKIGHESFNLFFKSSTNIYYQFVE